ncbi:hypothetical protein FRC12_023844, partial [Ceratobasidium sp. 428]
MYPRGIAMLTNLYSSRVELIFACTLALIWVCTYAIQISRRHGPTDAEMVESLAFAPNQRLYILVLDNPDGSQPEESKWWSLVPRFPLEAPYDQYNRDQGPEDDVSQMLALDSHGASTYLVASNLGSVTAWASGAYNVDLTAPSTGPEVWIPLSHSDDCGGHRSEYSVSPATFAFCDDTVPADSRVTDTSDPILTGDRLRGTQVIVDTQDIGGTLVEPSIQTKTGCVGDGTNGCLDELRMLPGNQPVDAGTVDELLAVDSNVDVDASADMSLSSEDLVELNDVKQDSLADELARVGPTEDEYVDSGLTIAALLDELTHSDVSDTDVPTLENNPVGPADGIQDNVSLDAWVDMSLETDAVNEGTPLDTPQTNEDGTSISAGDEVDHASTTPNSNGLLLLSSVDSSELITNERADAFFADM